MDSSRSSLSTLAIPCSTSIVTVGSSFTIAHARFARASARASAALIAGVSRMSPCSILESCAWFGKRNARAAARCVLWRFSAARISCRAAVLDLAWRRPRVIVGGSQTLKRMAGRFQAGFGVVKTHSTPREWYNLAMKHKRQHYIPQSYLSAWCDVHVPAGHKPYVWVAPKSGGAMKKRAPGNLFHEKDMYTIKGADGARDLVLEHGLSQLEGLFSKLRRTVLNARKPLSYEDRLTLCAFVAVMHERTRGRRDDLRNTWQQVLDMGLRVSKWAESATPEQLKAMATPILPGRGKDSMLTMDDVQRMVDEPIQTWLPQAIAITVPILMEMNFTIYVTKLAPGFVTSDDPCLWQDPEVYKRPQMFRSVGLASPTIEITLPISPWQYLVLARNGLNNYINIDGMTIVPKGPLLTDEINRRTRVSAEEHIVVNQNVIRAHWFAQ